MNESRPMAAQAAPMTRVWSALTRRLAESRRRAADRDALTSMSPRDLCDLGLGRDEIARMTSPTAPQRWDD